MSFQSSFRTRARSCSNPSVPCRPWILGGHTYESLALLMCESGIGITEGVETFLYVRNRFLHLRRRARIGRSHDSVLWLEVVWLAEAGTKQIQARIKEEEEEEEKTGSPFDLYTVSPSSGYLFSVPPPHFGSLLRTVRQCPRPTPRVSRAFGHTTQRPAAVREP